MKIPLRFKSLLIALQLRVLNVSNSGSLNNKTDMICLFCFIIIADVMSLVSCRTCVHVRGKFTQLRIGQAVRIEAYPSTAFDSLAEIVDIYPDNLILSSYCKVPHWETAIRTVASRPLIFYTS